MNNLISIIVPTYKNPTCLKHCIDSFLNNMDKTYQEESDNKVEMVIVIDGYTKMYEDLLEEYDTDLLTIVGFEKNGGFANALNYGSEHAQGNLLLHINDDNVLPVDYNKVIYDIINSEVGLFNINTGCLTFNQVERTPSIFNFLKQDFGNPENFQFDSYCDWEIMHRDNITNLYNDGGIFPFLITKINYMKVGGFDIRYKSPFIVDWDFFLKLELIGCKFARTRAISLYHFGSISTKNSDEGDKFRAGEVEASKVFNAKWGFNPIRYPDNNSHLLREFRPDYIKLTDVK